MAQALTELVDKGLGYDRRVPGKRSNIDHLFVGAGGVFVIDAKRYKDADVKVEHTGGLFSPVTETLKVGNRRRTNLVDAVVAQGDVVRASLARAGQPEVRVVLVLCFVGASLPLREKNRRVDAVRLCGPKGLASVAAGAGLLTDETRFEIAIALSAALPSLT